MPVRPEDYNEGQRYLVDDGFPAELLLTREERRAAWAKIPGPTNWASNNRQGAIDNHKESEVIMRKTNTKATTATEEPVEVKGSGNSGAIDFRQMNMGQLVATHNELATRAGASHATDFPSLLAGIHACQALEKKLSAPQTPAGEKETNVAKKAKAVKSAKKVKAVTAKVDAVDNRTAICKDFGARDGTNRQKLIDCVHGAGAKGATRAVALKAVYGSGNTDNAGAMDMVWKGVPDMIAKNRLGAKYEASRTGKGEETVYVIKKK